MDGNDSGTTREYSFRPDRLDNKVLIRDNDPNITLGNIIKIQGIPKKIIAIEYIDEGLLLTLSDQLVNYVTQSSGLNRKARRRKN